jgi:hypothetical protein
MQSIDLKFLATVDDQIQADSLENHKEVFIYFLLLLINKKQSFFFPELKK